MASEINLSEMGLDQLQALLVRVEGEIVRKQQVAKDETLAQIKQLIEAGGLTSADLKKVLGVSAPVVRVGKKAPILFRGPNREEWTGRGQWPRWLKDTGRSKQDFCIDEEGKTPYEREQG